MPKISAKKCCQLQVVSFNILDVYNNGIPKYIFIDDTDKKIKRFQYNFIS